MDALQEDSRRVEQLIGGLLAETLDDAQARVDFIRSWHEAPPGIRIDVIEVAQSVQRPPAPIPRT